MEQITCRDCQTQIRDQVARGSVVFPAVVRDHINTCFDCHMVFTGALDRTIGTEVMPLKPLPERFAAQLRTEREAARVSLIDAVKAAADRWMRALVPSPFATTMGRPAYGLMGPELVSPSVSAELVDEAGAPLGETVELEVVEPPCLRRDGTCTMLVASTLARLANAVVLALVRLGDGDLELALEGVLGGDESDGRWVARLTADTGLTGLGQGERSWDEPLPPEEFARHRGALSDPRRQYDSAPDAVQARLDAVAALAGQESPEAYSLLQHAASNATAAVRDAAEEAIASRQSMPPDECPIPLDALTFEVMLPGSND